MTLPTKTLEQLVDDQIATWGAATGTTPVLSSGDFLLAVFQANGSQLDFLQALVLLLVKLTRAATSTGADLDSWMADFGFTREPATFASSIERLSKNAPATSVVTVFPGAVVQTPGGLIQYAVVTDTSQAAWVANAALDGEGAPIGGYVLQIGQASMNVTIQAPVAGSSSNVIAGALNQPGSAIAGIDTVTNPTNIINGVDAESDAALRLRFVLYMQTLAKGTKAAIETAIAETQQNLTYVLLENENPALDTMLGAFTAVIDDGSGAPPQTVLDAVAASIESVRAFTIQPYVVAPVLVPLTIHLNVRVAAGFNAGAVTGAVNTAVVAQVGGLLTDTDAFISQIEAAAGGVAGVVSVQPGFTTINGAQEDFEPTAVQRVTTNAGLVNVGTY